MVVSMEPMITIPDGQPGAGGYRYSQKKLKNLYSAVELFTIFFKILKLKANTPID